MRVSASLFCARCRGEAACLPELPAAASEVDAADACMSRLNLPAGSNGKPFTNVGDGRPYIITFDRRPPVVFIIERNRG